MTQDPMVSALQGPPDPAMDALFQQPPPSVLTEQMLRQKGREMLQDPNRPQYNPNNVDRPIIPGEQGSPFQGILNPRGWGTMVQHPHLQHMAGDILQGPTHWQAPRPPISPSQSGGAAGMWNLSRGDPYAVDTLGVHLTPDAKAAIESMAGPSR
jgi:hypothetical protein